MNQNELTERLLLQHPDTINHYRQKYQLYKLLNLDFDLFFSEDIINYNNDNYIYVFNFHDGNIFTKYPSKKSRLFKFKFRGKIYVNETNIIATPIKDDDIIIIENQIMRVYNIHYINNSSIPIYYILSSTFSEKKFSPEQQKLLKHINHIYINSNYSLTNLSDIIREIELVNHESK